MKNEEEGNKTENDLNYFCSKLIFYRVYCQYQSCFSKELFKNLNYLQLTFNQGNDIKERKKVK